MLVTVSMYGAEEPPTPTGEAGQAQLLLATGAPATRLVQGRERFHPASVMNGSVIVGH